MKPARFILSCKGNLTVQFLLGFMLILVFVMLFTLMSFTLAVSEITQYVTYAASRSLFLGDGTKGHQQNAARDKYENLISNPPLDKFFRPNMFQIAEPSELRPPDNFLGLNRRFPPTSGAPNLFYGVWTKFIPKVLELDTPWGSTEEDATFFETVVGSYLGREPSKTECEEFDKKRWEFILDIHGSIPEAANPYGDYNGYSDTGDLEAPSDNGC